MSPQPYSVLELYSGIGGMHWAMKDAGIPFEVVLAIDINTVANEVYKHNFPYTNLKARSLESLNAVEINKVKPNVLLMSPPCQPFTKNGNQKDNQDMRTKSFIHVLGILKDLKTLKYILMENVAGFADSKCEEMFNEALDMAGFTRHHVLLGPKHYGIPNSRLRYFAFGTKKEDCDSVKSVLRGFEKLPIIEHEPLMPLSNFTKTVEDESLLLPDDFLLRVKCLDIVCTESQNTCCFTKGYTHYADGTGSVFSPKTRFEIDEIYEAALRCDMESPEFLGTVKRLRLRFFSPEEVAALMCFPDEFKFPHTTTRKQKYRLLGNSVNVKVVSDLLKLLLVEKC